MFALHGCVVGVVGRVALFVGLIVTSFDWVVCRCNGTDGVEWEPWCLSSAWWWWCLCWGEQQVQQLPFPYVKKKVRTFASKLENYAVKLRARTLGRATILVLYRIIVQPPPSGRCPLAHEKKEHNNCGPQCTLRNNIGPSVRTIGYL
jgi:hypothetical protein